MGQIALLGSIIFVIWLFLMDRKERPVGSPALWIPALWILLMSTRPIAYWFNGLSFPIDAIFLNVVILLLLMTLASRRVNWGAIVFSNISIFALYLFFLASAVWAEDSFSVLKRVVRDFSTVLTALVLLSESNPGYAIRKIIVRCSYLVFPLSIVAIKYFPSIGRDQANSGDNMFTGLTMHRNTLGQVAFLYCIVLLWDVYEQRRESKLKWTDWSILSRLLMMAMGVWLLNTGDSKTSILCLMLGAFVFWITGRILRTQHPKPKLAALTVGLLLALGIGSVFNLKDLFLWSIGRSESFSGRATIWDQVLAQPVNRFIGAGYQTFWDSRFGQNVIAGVGAEGGGETLIVTAHNGYIDILIDGGAVAVTLLGLMLLGRGVAIVDRMVAGDMWARVGFSCFLCAVIHNLSESTFFKLSILWFFLILSMLTYPAAKKALFEPNQFRRSDWRSAPATGQKTTTDTPAPVGILRNSSDRNVFHRRF